MYEKYKSPNIDINGANKPNNEFKIWLLNRLNPNATENDAIVPSNTEPINPSQVLLGEITGAKRVF